ncbi:MAG TPA: helix-turn-helix transcriptional regulator [Bacillus sp. (in: firmicutes)]|uniref:helix-turn-helix domain-containing protein n=1 Tax=Bacillus litorisediminis TaxID=2922713 RepID=UPI001FAEEA05|nr:helix-turn-helix transcriptional regulator [Bacillus litorisediminis]HWO76945.1 helix-turn-helix transcriptional regulator [Bacillus sp. (in: firmicutes)]
MLTLGQRIKYVRKSNKLNQIEFAKIIGVSQGTLSELEKDKYKPSIETIISIYEVFKVDLEWLLVNSTQFTEDTYIKKVEDKEGELLRIFKLLSVDDQDEILGIINLKLNRYQNQG